MDTTTKRGHEEFLRKLGLSPRGSAVYLYLLAAGDAGVSDIARALELTRVMVYDALEELKEGGLVVTRPKGKYKSYSAASPTRLEERFVALSEQFDAQIAALSALADHKGGERPVVEYREGKKGIVAIYDDIAETLKKGEMYYRYSSTKVTNGERRGSYVSNHYRVLRTKKQIERRVITNVENKALKRPNLEREVKVVPPDFDLFAYDVSQVIYADKVAVIDYNTETAMVIENKTIAQFQKKLFELLWKKL